MRFNVTVQASSRCNRACDVNKFIYRNVFRFILPVCAFLNCNKNYFECNFLRAVLSSDSAHTVTVICYPLSREISWENVRLGQVMGHEITRGRATRTFHVGTLKKAPTFQTFPPRRRHPVSFVTVRAHTSPLRFVPRNAPFARKALKRDLRNCVTSGEKREEKPSANLGPHDNNAKDKCKVMQCDDN